MADKGLIEALEKFGDWTTLELKEMCFVAGEDRKRKIWSVQDACKKASEALQQQEIDIMKFEYLCAGLRKHGMESLYERIMREPLP